MRETENSRRYHFADFTRDNYAALVRLALKRYKATTYDAFNPGERFLLWRHDVDFSVHAALRLAEIEAREGLVSTYFFLLHSEFYNLLEAECFEAARKILALGHRLGLHFDHKFWRVSNSQVFTNSLQFEKLVLEQIFGCRVEAFSFHIPDATTDEFDADQYCGVVNAYSRYLKADVDYCSDSNGYWRHQRLENVLHGSGVRSLQVLTHPEYWQDAVMSPRERVERCINGRANKTRDWYASILARSGRLDVDW
jgi:hypothetical protein